MCLTSPPATEETGATGRKIESHHVHDVRYGKHQVSRQFTFFRIFSQKVVIDLKMFIRGCKSTYLHNMNSRLQ
jgi:hypothetical protein